MEFDLEEGLESVLPKMLDLLNKIDSERATRLKAGYSDVFEKMEFSSHENKEFLFEDLVLSIDLSLPAGWTFGPEEDFSPVYRFHNEDIFL